ncbi:MAG: hypothetical protein GXO82_10125 [Chlorobi bacterium]|nr:hypothetical protein [Chlorobiota bacterium]
MSGTTVEAQLRLNEVMREGRRRRGFDFSAVIMVPGDAKVGIVTFFVMYRPTFDVFRASQSVESCMQIRAFNYVS